MKNVVKKILQSLGDVYTYSFIGNTQVLIHDTRRKYILLM